MGRSEDPTPAKVGEERLRILLVDDEANIRNALCEYLSAINRHEVVCAASGAEALDKFAAGRDDCAVLDLKMPGMSGVELIARIKEKDQALPVVVMTGYPSLDAAINTMRQGASDFLIKPFNLHQIKATLERVVREQQLLKENRKLATPHAKDEIENLIRSSAPHPAAEHVLQISAAIDRLQTSPDLYQAWPTWPPASDVARSAVCCWTAPANQLLIARSRLSAEVWDRPPAAGPGDQGKVAAEGNP